MLAPLRDKLKGVPIYGVLTPPFIAPFQSMLRCMQFPGAG